MAKVTNKQILMLFQVLSKLDPSDSTNRTKSAYQFKAKVVYALARNFRRLKQVVEDLEKSRLVTFKKYQIDNEETLMGDAAKAFNKDFNELLETTVDFEFLTINIQDLELDKNSISMDVIAELLDYIIVGEIS